MDENIEKQILHELRVIKMLLAHSVFSGESSQKQIRKLDELGLPPREIADILGKTSNTVSVTLSALRKKKVKEEKE